MITYKSIVTFLGFCLILFVLFALFSGLWLKEHAYQRTAILDVNMAKIVTMGAMFRDAKFTPKTMPPDQTIRYYMIQYTNYNQCASYPFWEDIAKCMDNISDAEVRLVRQAVADPNSFRVYVQLQEEVK